MQGIVSRKMPRKNKSGKRQHARCCLDLYVLQQSTDRGAGLGEKLFKMCVGDIICTVRGDSDNYLKPANSLHKNLQFTLEKLNIEGDSAFPNEQRK